MPHHDKEGRGIKDLLSIYIHEKECLENALAYDWIVGHAAASIYIEGQIASLYVNTITSKAKEELEKAGIKVTYKNEIETITNHEGNAPCPMEIASENKKGEEAILSLIKQCKKMGISLD